MMLAEAVGTGIVTVLKWIWTVYKGLCDIIGISEWAIISAAITLLTVIIGVNIYKARH